MNRTRTLLLYLTLAVLCVTSARAADAHGHLNAGAENTKQGSKLIFTNGDIFALGSRYTKELTYTNSGKYAGFFQGGLTLTALPQTIDNGGPTANAPAFGSFIEARIISVQGPAGGEFGFWETGATAPTFSIASGTTGGTFRFALSDATLGAGEAGADPFGHIHGRRFTASEEGLYTVGFKLFDVSANGMDFGPIHSASDALLIQFSAVSIPEPSTLALGLTGALIAAFAWFRSRKITHE